MFSKTFKNGMDDDDVDKKHMYIYRRRCSYFLRHFHIETPRNAHLYIPPFHLWTIKYLDQHVKIGNVFYVYRPFSFFDLFKLFVFFTRRTHGQFVFFENESIQPTAGICPMATHVANKVNLIYGCCCSTNAIDCCGTLL
jgi:hypothetical protein